MLSGSQAYSTLHNHILFYFCPLMVSGIFIWTVPFFIMHCQALHESMSAYVFSSSLCVFVVWVVVLKISPSVRLCRAIKGWMGREERRYSAWEMQFVVHLIWVFFSCMCVWRRNLTIGIIFVQFIVINECCHIGLVWLSEQLGLGSLYIFIIY